MYIYIYTLHIYIYIHIRKSHPNSPDQYFSEGETAQPPLLDRSHFGCDLSSSLADLNSDR